MSMNWGSRMCLGCAARSSCWLKGDSRRRWLCQSVTHTQRETERGRSPPTRETYVPHCADSWHLGDLPPNLSSVGDCKAFWLTTFCTNVESHSISSKNNNTAGLSMCAHTRPNIYTNIYVCINRGSASIPFMASLASTLYSALTASIDHWHVIEFNLMKYSTHMSLSLSMRIFFFSAVKRRKVKTIIINYLCNLSFFLKSIWSHRLKSAFNLWA